MARPPYPQEMATELALHTSFLIGEITENSGKKPADLEKIFRVGTNANGNADRAEAGKRWREWKRGEGILEIETEQKIKKKALDLGWLSHAWHLDYIITGDNWCRNNQKRTAGEKIERYLREIVRILPTPAAGDPAPPFGDFLADLYIADCHVCQEGWGEPVEAEERDHAAAALEKSRKKCYRLFGQAATGKIEKRLRKIVDILTLELPGDVALCHRIGARLQERYAAKA